MLYVGCAVLILLDRAYQSRFWTSFEAWLALRTATAEGLVNTPCPTDTGATEGGLAQLSPRASVATVYGAPGALIQSLQEEWAMCTREEAREKLKSPDVSVSNGKDKAVQLGRWEDGKVEGCKIFELDDLAREEMASDSPPQGARYSGSCFRTRSRTTLPSPCSASSPASSPLSSVHYKMMRI